MLSLKNLDKLNILLLIIIIFLLIKRNTKEPLTNLNNIDNVITLNDDGDLDLLPISNIQSAFDDINSKLQLNQNTLLNSTDPLDIVKQYAANKSADDVTSAEIDQKIKELFIDITEYKFKNSANFERLEKYIPDGALNSYTYANVNFNNLFLNGLELQVVMNFNEATGLYQT